MRRESNPSPKKSTLFFIHVRSRRIPCDWVRGFSHDLALMSISVFVPVSPHLTQPWWLTVSLSLGRPNSRLALKPQLEERLRYRSQMTLLV